MPPLARGLESVAASRTSLAIVVISGLLNSLILTLSIAPMSRCIAPKRLMAQTRFSSDVLPGEQADG